MLIILVINVDQYYALHSIALRTVTVNAEPLAQQERPKIIRDNFIVMVVERGYYFEAEGPPT